MICEDMICEKCATEGKTSRVRNTHIVKTLGAYLPFYDKQGRQHFHDANMTNAEYRCTNGHVWHTRGTGSCWCGWPNEQKAMSKHTPGPWHYAESSTTVNFARAAVHDPEDANAHLIAAAPDLLEALKALLDAVVRRDHKDKALRTARAAIAKAKGQSSSTDTARATE